MHGSLGAKAAEVKGALDGILGLEAEIVGGGPEPEAGELGGVAGALLGTQADEHVVLSGSGEVGGRISIFQNQVQAASAESLFEGDDFDGALEFDGDGEGVAVKDGRRNNL